MLIQVFQLTPEQINALPADQRAGVHQLVSFTWPFRVASGLIFGDSGHSLELYEVLCSDRMKRCLVGV